MKSSVVSQSKNLPMFKQIGCFLAKTICSAAIAIALVSTTSANNAVAGPRQASIVVDTKSGKIMFSEDPDGLRYPASLTKMMTLYMVFEALESGRISLNTKVPVSKHAASEPPSKLGVRAGSTFTVEQGILALVTRSANDCATAMGEFIGGSEARFGKMMTAKAKSLGMTRTVYYNANGLPEPRQVTTARDQARLGIALRQHYPQYYKYFSTRRFSYGKQVIGNHNRLLGSVRGVDGIKTGYTRAAGFNLVTSAQVDGRSIVGVVMGSPSGGKRNAKMRKLVETYLPRASRKGNSNNNMVASKKQAEIAYAEPANNNAERQVAAVMSRNFELPANGPVPKSRYKVEANADLLADEPMDGEDQVAQLVASADPSPADNDNAEQVSSSNAKVDSVTTASTSNEPAGWVIQVGAAPEKNQAVVLLQKAQDKGGKVLRSATPFTVAYLNGNEQLYRARFGGFADQDAAVSACKLLKKKGMGCWAALQ